MSIADVDRGLSPVIEPEHFRKVMSAYPTGVTIITAATANGPIGVTANSFTSVSLDPAMVLFCAAETSTTWPRIQAAGTFVVNLMSERGRGLVERFAGASGDRFAGVSYSAGYTGAPILEGANAFIECVLEKTFVVGDHTVVVGRVITTGGDADDRPLVFHRRAFLTAWDSGQRSD